MNPSSCVEVTTACPAVPASSAIRPSLVEKRCLCGRFLDQAPARVSVHCDLATTNRGEPGFARTLRAVRVLFEGCRRAGGESGAGRGVGGLVVCWLCGEEGAGLGRDVVPGWVRAGGV